MQIERSRHLQADLYERNVGRVGYANGYKPKTMKTCLGEVNLAIPQTRGTAFYPKSLANTDSKVTYRGYLEINRICGREEVQGAVGEQFAKEKGIKTA